MSEHIAIINIIRKRGDNFPFQFTLTDEAGAAVPITGFSFRMVVDPSNAPDDTANNIFDLAASIVDGSGGIFEFSPTTMEMDITPKTYFYEVQMTDASSDIRSIVQGTFIIEQDIVK